jgi:hypothetical protein
LHFGLAGGSNLWHTKFRTVVLSYLSQYLLPVWRMVNASPAVRMKRPGESTRQDRKRRIW